MRFDDLNTFLAFAVTLDWFQPFRQGEAKFLWGHLVSSTTCQEKNALRGKMLF